MKKSRPAMIALGLAALMAAGRPLVAEEEMIDSAREQKIEIEALKEAVEGLTTKTEYLDRFKVEGFTDIRYDDKRTPYTGTGEAGMYIKRAEIKMNGKLAPSVTYSLGFDFAASKLKDAGVEIADINLIPTMDFLPEWTYQLRVGQYRQPFGIVPQTSSSKINLAERPMIFGGVTLTHPQAFTTKIVGERVMGLFLTHKKKLIESGMLAWELQGAVSNDVTEDQVSGATSVAAGFPLQSKDQDPSWQGRASFNSNALDFLLGEKSKIQAGMSYSRDSINSVWMASVTGTVKVDETYGAEFVLEGFNKMLIVQSEWVRQNAVIVFPKGVTKNREGFYADVLVDVLPFLTTPEKGDALQLIFRAEKYMETKTAGLDRGGMDNLVGLAGGLKWSYMGGKNHTAINYYVQASDGQFGGYVKGGLPGITVASNGAPSTLFLIQQQFAFE
ncbi:MAG: porin [candidate division FCPU426 bacterium]